MPKGARRLDWLLAALALAAALRLLGIGWGLPFTYNADEPHLVNMAVSFGGGTLRPYAFKYPTLWPYLLAAAYGVYFLAWSCFGLLRGVQDFIGLYCWHPGGFFLIARLLSGAASLAAAWVLARAERARHPERPPWAALLLAFCPLIVDLSHSSKPDCAMLLFATIGWAGALAVLDGGGRRAHWLSGAGFGLAMACQYTALPAATALPLAALLSRARPPKRWLAEGLGACALALFAGSPYLVLDFPRFASTLRDLGAYGQMLRPDLRFTRLLVACNMIGFGGPGSLAGAAAVAGLARLLRRERALGAVLAGPLLAYFLIVGNSADGGLSRYILGGFPALALLAAEGLSWPRFRGAAVLAAALALGPAIARSAWVDWSMVKPDTRELATAWVRENVPQGDTVLVDEPHASPIVPMTREEALELYEKTRAMGSPRARLYRGMAETHPGGGYRVLRIGRAASDLSSAPRHVEQTHLEVPTLEVAEGWPALRRAGVRWVVTSAYGATPRRSPQLGKFFDDLYRKAELVRTFAPDPERGLTGPVLRVFKVQ